MSQKLPTRAIHSSYKPEEHNGALMPPIYQNSMFLLHYIEEGVAYSYSRVGNPTRTILEDTIADLEEGIAGFAFASGIAAIDAIWRTILRPGDTILAVSDIYGGSYELLTSVYRDNGIKTVFEDLTDRDHLEEIYAHTFKAEDALVRPQIISGTHAITLALQSTLKYGDELLYITGSPYDTLLEVIGVNGNGIESLKEHGVHYNEVKLNNGKIDISSVLTAINEKTKVVAIQRSKGYDQRPSIPVNEIEEAIETIRKQHPNVIIFVDNCYGEFVEDKEPIEVGADIIAGSLIKNPGGGLAKIGGYIAGRKDLSLIHI